MVYVDNNAYTHPSTLGVVISGGAFGDHMDILVTCPANCATGGPEAIHQLVSNLSKIDGVTARIWYWDAIATNPQPNEYASYGCEYVTEKPKGFNGVLIVPEIWANKVMAYTECVRCIWWLGIDAYAAWTPENELGAFLSDPDIFHIAQSDYAMDFLRKLKVRHLYKITDTVNAEFYEPFEETDREDVVLYNPAKATQFMWNIMDACRGVKFKPIQDMTRAEVIDAMRHAKLFVDFGEFPGRERMPREAVLCGCCLVTSKLGAADFYDDFAHTYKYDSKPSHVWAIAHKIRYVLAHYDECHSSFSRFYQDLLADRYRVKWETEMLVNEIQRYYPGL